MICDVSKYQGNIDWGQFALNLDFVIIKASGRYENGADPQYANNVLGATRMSVPFHAYHYLYCLNEDEARRDAGLFYRTVKAEMHMPLFWVLDCEAGWGIADRDARRVAEAFEAELRRLAGQDIRVAVYVAQEKYYDYALDYSRYAYVWIPGYGEKYKPTMPHDMWQYTSSGTLNGINGRVDLNVLSGTKPLEYFTGGGAADGIGGVDRGDRDGGAGVVEPVDGGERKMLTGKQLAEYCEMVYKAGWAYWYGTYGKQCSQSLYEAKKKQYPSHYGNERKAGYMKDIADGKRCADCVGLIKAFFWTGGQFGAEPKYAANGCPDKSADGMFDLCSKSGPISTIPDIPGIVVWKSGHIGVYVGGGYTVELKGFAYDCQRNRVTAGPWVKWGKLPASMIEYTTGTVEPVAPEPAGLKKGDYGSAVKAMQKALLAWDAGCLPRYGADGEFGSETEKAVKAFQQAAGLLVTGVYDEATRNALANARPVAPPAAGYVEVTGGSVNVRSAPNTDGRILGVVYRGDRLPYQGQDSADGWHLIAFKNQNAWVSGKYSRLVD